MNQEQVLGLLREKAADEGEALDGALQRHLQQRLVAWVASSALREALILKGASLLDVFPDPKAKRWHRKTQHADFVSRSLMAPAAIHEALVDAHADNWIGASFDLESLSVRAAPTYRGAPTCTGHVVGRVHKRSLTLALRIEHIEGDLPVHADVYVHPVTDVPKMPHPRPLALAIEEAIADRVESLYWCGVRGVRFEDFADLLVLIEATSVDPNKVSSALAKTFKRRDVPLPTSLPASLRERFFNDPTVDRRWERFVQRHRGLRAESKAAQVKNAWGRTCSLSTDESFPSVAKLLADRVSAWLAGMPRVPRA